MNEIKSWGISKQYLAAHYYLSEERPISISEAQRAQLGALHLHASYGPYNSALEIPDLLNCTIAEKKKRASEWQKLGVISRITAMKKFIDLITSLFPNWSRFRKLYHEFEMEWANMPESNQGKRPEPPRPVTRKKPERKEINIREGTPLAFKKIFDMKKSRNRRARSRVQEKSQESPELIFRTDNVRHLAKSQLPKIANSYYQYQQKDDEYLKEFIEGLQSYKGGDIRKTSATKLPKGVENGCVCDIRYKTPDVDFSRQMKNYRRDLLNQEYSKLTEKPMDKVGNQQIIPNIMEKINQMKSTIKHIEDEFLTSGYKSVRALK